MRVSAVGQSLFSTLQQHRGKTAKKRWMGNGNVNEPIGPIIIVHHRS